VPKSLPKKYNGVFPESMHGTLFGYRYGCRCNPCYEAKKSAMESSPAATLKRELIERIKAAPCTDCGGCFPAVCMEFDHRDPSTKLFTISFGSTRTWEKLVAEIAKCDVVCANCHALRTERQRVNGEIKIGCRRIDRTM
jgi:hypothetical protein